MKSNYIKENLFKIGLFVFLIIFIFYWFQLRPAQIRKECYKIIETPKDYFVPGSIANKYLGKTSFDEMAYKKCLLEHGLEN